MKIITPDPNVELLRKKIVLIPFSNPEIVRTLRIRYHVETDQPTLWRFRNGVTRIPNAKLYRALWSFVKDYERKSNSERDEPVWLRIQKDIDQQALQIRNLKKLVVTLERKLAGVR